MYVLTKDIMPGCVVWAHKKVYYDRPGEKIDPRRSMFLITMVNEDYFLGCPLSKNTSTRNRTVLYKEHYPIKYNSRITEDLYEIKKEDIFSGKHFAIRDKTFEYFKRSLYQRIIVNEMISPKIYSEMFVEDYIKDHHPSIDNVVIYPSEDKIFKFYYIYDENENDYFGIRLDRTGYDNYCVMEPDIKPIPKRLRFYDYYEKKVINREEIEKVLVKKK